MRKEFIPEPIFSGTQKYETDDRMMEILEYIAERMYSINVALVYGADYRSTED